MDEGRLQALAGIRSVVSVDLGNEGVNSIFLFDLPARAGVGCALKAGVAFDKKSNAIADLGQCRVCAKVPDGGGQNVFARSKVPGNVVGFVAPMRQIGAARPRADTLSIHIENELIVCAHVNYETGWSSG